MSAFAIPLSGLTVSSDALDLIANNLANLNTDGYKDESLSFSALFNQMQGVSGNGDPIQYGSGVEVGGTNSNYTNGTVDQTGIASNMALQGNGFFVVEDTGNNQMSYTRNGDFTTNAQGELTTSSGEVVMGYPAVDGAVNTSAALIPINVNQQSNIPASATTTFQMTTNLDSSGGLGATFSSPITVYDSLGNSQTLTVNFTNTGTNTWSYDITIPSSAVGGTGTSTQVSTGTLTFNSSGELVSPTSPITGIDIKNLADGAANMSLSWNLTGSDNSPILTQQDSASVTSATTQDGYGVGILTGYSILSDGTVEGQFSNNQTLTLGQVAIANFANVQGLAQTGNGNMLGTSLTSGNPIIGIAGEGGNGTITGGAVEASNVDLASEFANMIVAQQGYEANAKALTTMDQVSQATIQLVS